MAKNALIRKLERLLASHLADFQAGLLPGSGHDRVTGYVVSSEFRGKDHTARQRKLLALLNNLEREGRITGQERARVGPIVTMTPAEAEIGDTAA